MSDTSVNWFEIPVNDLDRAASFYGTVLETRLEAMETPAGPGRSFQGGGMPVGALVMGPANVPSQEGPLVYLGTTDVDAALRRVVASGGKVLMEKTSIGPFGNIGHFVDSEGNRMALHSN